MCEVSTAFGGTLLSQLPNILSVGAGALGAIAAISEAGALSRAANQNAQLQVDAAQDALKQGGDQQKQRRLAGAQTIAKQKAALAANGVDLGSATALDIIDDTQFLIDEDAFTISENAVSKGNRHLQEADNFRAEARNVKSRGFFKATGSLLTSASRVNSRYRDLEFA